MLKTILITLLAIFFILNGLNHFYNEATLEEYAEKHGVFAARIMVRLAGILLILGGLALMIPAVRLIGIIGLSVFLVLAGFMIHRFWKEKEKNARLLESMHFAKNMAILTELLYIGFA